MSYEYDEAVLDAFLEQQEKLFPEAVAESREEAEEFIASIRKKHKDAVGDGRYLIVDA